MRKRKKLKTDSRFFFSRRACEARALRARMTLTARFTDFFTDFEKKSRLFCSLCATKRSFDLILSYLEPTISVFTNVVRSPHFIPSPCFLPSPQSVVRSPQSAVHSPQSEVYILC